MIIKHENHIKCRKCGGTEFLISESGKWEARSVYSEVEKKWILEAYNNIKNGIDLIECKKCSEDYTCSFELDVEYPWII